MGVISVGKFIKLHKYNLLPLICVCYASTKSSEMRLDSQEPYRSGLGLSSNLLVPLPQELAPCCSVLVSTFDYVATHLKSHTASCPCPCCYVLCSLLPCCLLLRSHTGASNHQILSVSAPHFNSLNHLTSCQYRLLLSSLES